MGVRLFRVAFSMMLAEVIKGSDPATQRTEDRRAMSVRQLAEFASFIDCKHAETLFNLVEPGGLAIVSTPYNLAVALFNKFDAHHSPQAKKSV